jgi:hypothetical protein
MDDSSLGPVDFALLEFPAASFDGSIAAALADLADRDIVTILDLVIVHKTDEGGVEIVELSEAESRVTEGFERVDGEVRWLLSDRDVRAAADELATGSTGLLLVWENKWTRSLRDAIGRAGGRLVVQDRLDADEVAAAMASGG